MNATLLLTLQFSSLVTMLIAVEGLFENKIATIIFATALFIFASCTSYISKNSKRLLKELEREQATYKRVQRREYK